MKHVSRSFSSLALGGLPQFLDNTIDLINGNTTRSALILSFAPNFIYERSSTILHNTVVNFKTINDLYRKLHSSDLHCSR